MANPMKRFVTDDGRKFLIPGDHVREPDPNEGVWCACHKMMGNDFYFLPTGSCLRKEKVCNGLSGRV